MPTYKEVYGPLIDMAVRGCSDAEAEDALRRVASGIAGANPDKTTDECFTAAKNNLDYYCQYYSPEVCQQVKQKFGLGQGFMTLAGLKLA